MDTTVRINSTPVVAILSGNIVLCLDSDVISNEYGNNGSQCYGVLGDLKGNLIRSSDGFEINPCPHCIYTIYNCLSDGLWGKVNVTMLNQWGEDLLQCILLLGDYISFWIDPGNSESYCATFLHCRHIVWFITSLCHIIIFLAVLLAASSTDISFYIILLKIWKGKIIVENFLLLAWIWPSYRSIHASVLPRLLFGEGSFMAPLCRAVWDWDYHAQENVCFIILGSIEYLKKHVINLAVYGLSFLNPVCSGGHKLKACGDLAPHRIWDLCHHPHPKFCCLCTEFGS